MYSEDDLLPISALQHLLFCERQTALIHIERQWADNRFTAEGNVLHQKADAAKSETRDGIRITRGLQVHSFEIGLYGVCDVVQFQPPELGSNSKSSLAKRIERELERARHPCTDESGARADVAGRINSNPEHASPLPFTNWVITPVEYKRGKPKANDCDRVQLCAQALCLEEMLQVQIPRGDLFYGKEQRRTDVPFDERLRQTTRQTGCRLHELIRSQTTPTAFREKKCDTCSLLSLCMPPTEKQQIASEYIKTMIQQ